MVKGIIWKSEGRGLLSAVAYKFSSGLCKWRENDFRKFPQWSERSAGIPVPQLHRSHRWVFPEVVCILHNNLPSLLLFIKCTCPRLIHILASMIHFRLIKRYFLTSMAYCSVYSIHGKNLSDTFANTRGHRAKSYSGT